MNLHPSLDDKLNSLSSAEEFLNFFNVPYAQEVVQVNRLHILKRFHDYVARNNDDMPDSADEQQTWLKQWLKQAYEDFVTSNAQTEKVFRVFRMTPRAEGGSSTFVPLEEMFQ